MNIQILAPGSPVDERSKINAVLRATCNCLSGEDGLCIHVAILLVSFILCRLLGPTTAMQCGCVRPGVSSSVNKRIYTSDIESCSREIVPGSKKMKDAYYDECCSSLGSNPVICKGILATATKSIDIHKKRTNLSVMTQHALPT